MKAEDLIREPDSMALALAVHNMNLANKQLEEAEIVYQAARKRYHEIADEAALAREHWRAVNNDRLRDDISHCRLMLQNRPGSIIVMRADKKAVVWLDSHMLLKGRRYVMFSRETASKYGDSWEYDGWAWDEVE